MDLIQIARICHETNRAYCASIGDDSQRPWDAADVWQRQSAIAGVKFALENPDAPAASQHDAWVADKVRDGWKLGPVKNADTKEHPCIVAYDELPLEQRVKDHLFRGIVQAFVDAVCLTAVKGELNAT